MNSILSYTSGVQSFVPTFSQNMFTQLTSGQKRVLVICAIVSVIFVALVALVRSYYPPGSGVPPKLGNEVGNSKIEDLKSPIDPLENPVDDVGFNDLLPTPSKVPYVPLNPYVPPYQPYQRDPAIEGYEKYQVLGSETIYVLSNLPPITAAAYDLPAAGVSSKEWENTVEFKLDLVNKAWKHFQEKTNPSKEQAYAGNPKSIDLWKRTAERVNEYFKETFRRLKSGENAPVPIYYHASRLGTDAIAGSSTLRQSLSGAQNAGVYFSNCDEYYNLYGACTFAMDPSQVEDPALPCTYQFSGAGHPKTQEEAALWMCTTNSDVTLASEKIAYLITPEDGGNTEADKIQLLWHTLGFYVPTMNRFAADEIRKSIKAVHIHEVPKHWKTFGCSYDYRTATYANNNRNPTGLKQIVAN